MDIYLGESGLTKTWQEPFPKTVECRDCMGVARIMFVAAEGTIAVYMCQDCFEPNTLKKEERMAKAEKIMCCFIGLDGKDCELKAEYAIYYGNSEADYTHSCASHIGELVDGRIDKFTVYRLPKEIIEGVKDEM